MRTLGIVLLTILTGCARSRPAPAPVPIGLSARPASDSLRIVVVYPAATDVLQSHDSAFLFGAVGGATGPVHLGVDGRSVPVLA
ncbi:MAG TPA: hypothetical protein VFI66_07280, partial [Gemmatimonadales bacterium]|nr:hypothetical protein [Gemmatimonadales bacterium]